MLRLILAAVSSAALLALSFPAPEVEWLAWIALVPLIVVLRNDGVLMALSTGWLCGILTAFGMFRWFLSTEAVGVGWAHTAILSVYIGGYLAAWSAGMVVLHRSRFPIVLSGAGLWVTLDYLRSHAGFLAVPIGSLAQSQHTNLPLLQAASVVGEYGISFLVIAVNIALAEWLACKAALRPILVTLAAATIVHALGIIRLAAATDDARLVMSVVQPSIRTGETNSVAGNRQRHERLKKLTRRAAQDKPNLIVWPETAVLNLTRSPNRVNWVQGLSDELDIPILLGTSEFEKFETSGSPGGVALKSYNSAYLVTPGIPLSEPYHKNLLLPFAEYLPLAGHISWPGWLVPQYFETVPGNKRYTFVLAGGHSFSVVICWENLFADYVRDALRGGSEFLLHISNDGWFRDPSLAMQHNAASVLRAVENQRAVVIASNTGPSQIIDAYGRIVAATPYMFQAGHITSSISLNAIPSFYSRYGDAFCLIAIALAAAGFFPYARIVPRVG